MNALNMFIKLYININTFSICEYITEQSLK